MRLCSVDGCGRKHYGKGLCQKCYCAQYRAANRERTREVQRKSDQRPERKQAQYERNKRNRLADPEKARNATNAWHAANREESRRRASEWQKNNPEKVAAIQHRRRARKRDAEGTWTPEDWSSILQEYGTVCPCCCRDGLPLTVDHVVPLAWGGTNWPSNLQPLCQECNTRKGDRHDMRYPPRQHNQNLCQSSVVEQSIEP